MEKPKPLAEIDVEKIVKACEAYMDFLNEDYSEDDQSDQEHYIFEDVINAVYGEDAWKWINSKMQ